VRVLAAATLALLASSCTSFLGWRPDPVPVQRGPIATRVQQPIKLTYLAFRPRAAETQPEGKLALSAISQYSNIFENGFSETEKVVLDGETWRNSLVARYGLSPSSDIEIEIPFMYTSGGFLDPIIEDFHHAFGFPNGGRESRPQNAYEMQVQTHGETAYTLDGYTVGLGDIPIVYTQQFFAQDGAAPSLAARFGVELPTGSESAGFGNGKLDGGAGLLAQIACGRWTTTSAIDYVHAGGSTTFTAADVHPSTQADAQLGLEYRWNDAASLLGGLVLDSPVTQDIHLKEIDKAMLSLDLGVAWDAGEKSQLYFGFTEDVIADSGPDIVFNIIWKYGF
jgi:hypothetical protein